MSLDCGATFAKVTLCFINFIFVLFGAGVLSLGTWLAVDSTSFFLITRITDNQSLVDYNLPSVVEQAGYILICVGGCALILAILGLVGAARESRVLLGVYGSLLIIVFLLQAAAWVLAAVFKNEVETEVQDWMKKSLREKYSTRDSLNGVTIVWNIVMSQLHCCGVNNMTDFEQASRWQENKSRDWQVPPACCILQGSKSKLTPIDSHCMANPTPINSYHTTGCYYRLTGWLTQGLDEVTAALICVGVTQLVIILFTFCLCASRKNGKTK